MPGLKLPDESVNVDVCAPEQARFRLFTPLPMPISAAVLRWQRGIVSEVPPLS
jgi:hypothetical protein